MTAARSRPAACRACCPAAGRSPTPPRASTPPPPGASTGLPDDDRPRRRRDRRRAGRRRARRPGRRRRRPRRHRRPGRRSAPRSRPRRFVVALELRETDVTRAADVVFPVAPVDRQGRHVRQLGGPAARRSRRSSATRTRCPTCGCSPASPRSSGRPLGFRTVAEARAEMEELGPWDGDRAALDPTPAPAVTGRGVDGRCALATWKLLLDNGAMQDGDDVPPATARTPVARVGAGGARRARAATVTRRPATAARSRCRSRSPTTWPTAWSGCRPTPPATASWPTWPRPAAGVTPEGSRAVSSTASLAGRLASAADDRPRAASATTRGGWSLLKAVLIFVILVLLTLFNIWFERRVVARMQHRIGPNVNGPFGLLQSPRRRREAGAEGGHHPEGGRQGGLPARAGDRRRPGVRDLRGDPVRPRGRRSRSPTRYTPLQLTDMPVAVLFVMAVASIGIYGIVLGGWSSGSTYSLLGGLRSSAQMISYEVAMGLALVAVFLYAGSMSTCADRRRPRSDLVVRPDPAAVVRDLHDLDGRRDQPRAVRPPRGRGRAGRRLPHRVLQR